MPVALPVYGVDARGRRREVTGLRYRRTGGDSISLTSNGIVTCGRRADARVVVSYEHLLKSFHLLCRPIAFIALKRLTVLTGGDSAELNPIAVTMEGEREPLIVGAATVQDTSIAYIDHGKVFGRRPGETNIIVDAGDCEDWTRVEVDEPVTQSTDLVPFQVFVGGPTDLAPGEFRAWPVMPGPYNLWIDGDAARGFAFGTSNMNCVAVERAGLYSCIALAHASVLVHNTRRSGSVRGTVFVSRKVDPGLDSSYSRTHPSVVPKRSAFQRSLPPGWCSLGEPQKLARSHAARVR